MAFKPKAGDSPAPRGFRRFVGKSQHEFLHALSLIKRDYGNITSEQLLNVVVEAHRRGNRNQVDGLLDYLGEMNGEQFAPEMEDRIE
jgi:hypothetical protein